MIIFDHSITLLVLDSIFNHGLFVPLRERPFPRSNLKKRSRSRLAYFVEEWDSTVEPFFKVASRL